jgi:long-chain acyl-CoA synthetase
LFNIDFIGAISAMTSPKAIELMMAKALQPTTLTAVPLFHVSGLHAQLLTALRHGRRLVFIHRWDPQQAIRLIQKEKITQFNGAPSMVMQLLAEPNFNDPEFTGSLGGVGFGGAGLPQRISDEMLEKRANSMSGIGYGLTETNGVCAAASGQLFQHAPQSAGVTSPIIEVRVVDLDGTDLPLGTEGEIWLRGVSLMEGYLNQQGEKGIGLSDGWLKTGDIGRLEEGGLLRIVDRIKDVINRAGEKIAAAEIESCLLQHPDLLEAAVFSQPDATTGEAVVAVVVMAPHAKLSIDDVKQHVAARLAAYKVPQQVHLRTEGLPKNPAGKMLKNALKREYVQA